MTRPDTPLSGSPPAEVPLQDPPLVRVIAQVRFPLIASVGKRDFIAPFQEAIRRTYPVLRPEETRGVVFQAQGAVETRTGTVWRFFDGAGDWRVSLAPDFVSLETTRYTSREDFLARLRHLLEALAGHVEPGVVDRVGLRYIDRVQQGDLARLPELVRPEVAGIMSTPLVDQAWHAIAQNVFDLPDGSGQLMARWGLVPANATVDPAAVDPIDEASWVLDLDASQSETRPFDVDEILARAEGFAGRIYAFFRWTVTDAFLRRYGGKP